MVLVHFFRVTTDNNKPSKNAKWGKNRAEIMCIFEKMKWFYSTKILFLCGLAAAVGAKSEEPYQPYCLKNQEGNPNVNVAYKCDSSSRKCSRTIVEREDGPRTCLMSIDVCKLLCDEYGSLWPKPSGTVSIEKQLVPINVGDIAFDVKVSDESNDLWNMFKKLEHYLLDVLKYSFKSRNVTTNGNELKIVLRVKDEKTKSFANDVSESYGLTVSTKQDKSIEVFVEAQNYLGIRHGIETLSQLIVYDEISKSVFIPGQVFVSDAPAYKYRGILLDTSRMYHSVGTIKRLLDGMAYNKLNTFHWHLTDSHSFPFVSKNYPKMATYGAYTPSQVYTWSDIVELVQYARIRGIRIVPELDTPAHVGEGWQHFNNESSAVILCFKGEPWKKYCVEPPCGILNPVEDEVYAILKKLYAEFNELFAPDVFHMGGDEVSFVCWNETSSVTEWMRKRNMSATTENFIKIWGMFQSKAMKAYDEVTPNEEKAKIILWTSSLTENEEVKKLLSTDRYIIQIWTKGDDKQIADLLNDGYDLILSNHDALYFDCGFGAWIGEGNNWCSPYIGWQKVYTNDPEKIVENLRSVYNVTAENPLSQILGAEAALWSEQSDGNTMDSRLWPRAAAFAERMWSNPKTDWRAAEKRFLTQRERMAARNIAPDLTELSWCYQNEGLCY